MGFEEIIMYQLSSKFKSLSVNISEYLNRITGRQIKYTKQAYSRARMKIRHEGYIELNDQIEISYYEEKGKTYKGYRLLGIDGSEIELPHGKSVEEHFGKANKNEKMINISWSTVLYDLENKLVVDGVLNPYGKSERKYAIEQLRGFKERGLQKKDIIVADRGFPSLELFIELEQMGYDFVIRYNGGQFLRETVEFEDSEDADQTIEVSVRYGKKRSINEAIKALIMKGCKETIKLRLIKVELNTGEKEYLVTSLLDREHFEIEDFKYIYNQRWNQEIYYDFQKNIIQIENFSGKTVESIYQDYHSRILVGNLHSMILEEADERIAEEVSRNKKLKYPEYKSNRAVTYGIMKDRIYNLLNEDNTNWEEEYDELVTLAVKHKIPIIKNRHFPRQKKGNLKYPQNKKDVI